MVKFENNYNILTNNTRDTAAILVHLYEKYCFSDTEHG